MRTNTLLQVDWENYSKNKKASLSKQSSASPAVVKASKKVPKPPRESRESRAVASPREDFAYVNNFLQDPANRQHPSSPSVRTIMTTATKVR